MPSSASRIVVTAAVIERDGRFLVTRRPLGVHLGGLWEFPGGKCEPGESLETCLRREIVEELDTEIHVGAEIYGVRHDYPERVVELHFFQCRLIREPRPVDGQEMRWVLREELATLQFPPADGRLIEMLCGRSKGAEE
jgi:8-oxo-dGTP diphosphatase